MHKQEWVAARYVRSLLSTEQARVHELMLLSQAGIRPEELRDTSGRVTVEQYTRLLDALWRLTQDEAFGFTHRRLRLGTFAMMCQVIISCSHLEDALRRCIQYYRIVTDDFHLSISRQPARVRLELRLLEPLRGEPSFFTEAIFAVILRLSSWLIDQPVMPHGLSFAYPREQSGHSFEGKFACLIHYGDGHSSMDLPRSILKEPIRRDRAELEQLLAGGPQQFLVDFKRDASFSARLRRCMVHDPENLHNSLEALAKYFGLSPSSLRRRLREEGCNFHDLREAVRKQKSLYYLKQTHKSIDAIAAIMGYSEPSTFHRAFKKWTGQTPRGYRQQLRGVRDREAQFRDLSGPSLDS
jgi:AraC-like DNA-binding protein